MWSNTFTPHTSRHLVFFPRIFKSKMATQNGARADISCRYFVNHENNVKTLLKKWETCLDLTEFTKLVFAFNDEEIFVIVSNTGLNSKQ